MKTFIYLGLIASLTGCVVVPYDHDEYRREHRHEQPRTVIVNPAPRVITPVPVYREYPSTRVIVVPAPERPRYDRDWDKNRGHERDRDNDRVQKPRPGRPAPIIAPDVKEGPRMHIQPIKPGEEKDVR